MEPATISPSDQLQEAALVSRILAGEKRLYEIIMRRYNQRLYRIGMSVLNNDADAEDAMQTAYIKAYEHLAQFRQQSSLSTWLIRIMINECLAQKKIKQRFDNGEIEKYLQNKSSMKTPAHVLMNKELNDALENAIAQLPEKYRLVFMLREIEELSVKETGDALDLEESNVKVRLNRAKTMLRENLNGYLKEHIYSFHLSRCDVIVNNVLAQLQIA